MNMNLINIINHFMEEVEISLKESLRIPFVIFEIKYIIVYFIEWMVRIISLKRRWSILEKIIEIIIKSLKYLLEKTGILDDVNNNKYFRHFLLALAGLIAFVVTIWGIYILYDSAVNKHIDRNIHQVELQMKQLELQVQQKKSY